MTVSYVHLENSVARQAEINQLDCVKVDGIASVELGHHDLLIMLTALPMVHFVSALTQPQAVNVNRENFVRQDHLSQHLVKQVRMD